jgi:hypothetical protein
MGVMGDCLVGVGRIPLTGVRWHETESGLLAHLLAVLCSWRQFSACVGTNGENHDRL